MCCSCVFLFSCFSCSSWSFLCFVFATLAQDSECASSTCKPSTWAPTIPSAKAPKQSSSSPLLPGFHRQTSSLSLLGMSDPEKKARATYLCPTHERAFGCLPSRLIRLLIFFQTTVLSHHLLNRSISLIFFTYPVL